MEITDVRIRSVKPEGKLRAFASITLDNCLAIHNLKVIEGEKGLFVAMPSRKTNRGEFKDVVHPTNNDLRAVLEQKVIGEYERAVEEGLTDTGSDEEMGMMEETTEKVASVIETPAMPNVAAPRVVAPAAERPQTAEPEVTPKAEEVKKEEPKEEPKEEKKSGGFIFRSLMGGK